MTMTITTESTRIIEAIVILATCFSFLSNAKKTIDAIAPIMPIAIRYGKACNKNDDIIIEIAANNTELEKQCADDKAEFISIKKSIPSEDMVAVQAERYTIHDEYTKSNIQKLQEKYGRKYSYDIYKDVEADVNMELHEKPFSILMRLEKNKQRNTDHNHTKYRNHEQER